MIQGINENGIAYSGKDNDLTVLVPMGDILLCVRFKDKKQCEKFVNRKLKEMDFTDFFTI